MWNIDMRMYEWKNEIKKNSAEQKKTVGKKTEDYLAFVFNLMFE